jgi:hypothetical protein
LLRHCQHVRLDIILTLVPARAPDGGVGDLLGFVVCVVLIRYGFAMSYDSWRLSAITIRTWCSRNGGCWRYCRRLSSCSRLNVFRFDR